jgi:hypothetical protein
LKLKTGLQRVEEPASEGKIKKFLVHEVSRIGRRNSVTHKFVENLPEMGVSPYWHQQRIDTRLPSGKRNPAAGIMLALLLEIAMAETETLGERILSGLEEASLLCKGWGFKSARLHFPFLRAYG